MEKYYRAFDERGYVACVEKSGSKWAVVWNNGKAQRYFTKLKTAKYLVEAFAIGKVTWHVITD